MLNSRIHLLRLWRPAPGHLTRGTHGLKAHPSSYRMFQSKILEEMATLQKKADKEEEKRQRKRRGEEVEEEETEEDDGVRGWGQSLLDHVKMTPQTEEATVREIMESGEPAEKKAKEERRMPVFDLSSEASMKQTLESNNGEKTYEDGINVTQFASLQNGTRKFLDRILQEHQESFTVDDFVRPLVEKMLIMVRILRYQDTSEGITACMTALEDNIKSMVMKDSEQLTRDMEDMARNRTEKEEQDNDGDDDDEAQYMQQFVSEEVMLDRFEQIFKVLTLFMGEDAHPAMFLRAFIMQVHFDRNDEIEQSYGVIKRKDMERSVDPSYVIYKALANHQLATYIAKYYSENEMRMLDALEYSTTACQLVPKSALILTTRAFLQRDFDKGLKDLDVAVRLEPENSEQYLHRARFLHMHGRNDDAYNDLDRASRAQPSNLEVYIQKCLFNLEQQVKENGPFDLTRCIRTFDTLLNIVPPRATFEIALESADTILENAKNMNYPKMDALVHMLTGMSHLAAARVEKEHHQGDRTEQITMAHHNFAHAVDLDPGFEEAQRHLTQAKWLLGELSK